MPNIAIVTKNQSILINCYNILSRPGFDDVAVIRCDNGPYGNDIPFEELSYNEPLVLIARGQRASMLAKRLPLPVVELPETGVNLVDALQRAQRHSRVIGVIGSPRICSGSKLLAAILGMTVHAYTIGWNESADACIERAKADGCTAVVGGYSALGRKDYESCGVPVFAIGADEECILTAIEQARQLASVILQQRQQNELLKSIFVNSHDGLIITQPDSTITMVNPAAQRLLNTADNQLLKSPVEQLCPEFSMERIWETGKKDGNIPVSLGNNFFVCNKMPVKSGEKIIGGLISFQDATQIQMAEASVRRKIIEQGYVAPHTFDDIIGTSKAILRAIALAKQFAVTDSSVLILGASGTGKELFAQSIHNFSRRSHGPFVAVNCAALPTELLESELFGYEHGAFTGARSKGKPGLFELAHGGTLFLDEIGEMPLQIQGKILRAVQEHCIMRIGGDRVTPVDVRIFAATNRNLAENVRSGKFREDLYYRLNVLRLQLPPLSSRPEDIRLLFANELKKHQTATGKKIHMDRSAMELLLAHPWPGNVRELTNIAERLFAVFGNTLHIDENAVRTILLDEQDLSAPAPGFAGRTAEQGSPVSELDEINRVLQQTHGNYSQAARILGITRMTLWRKLKRNQDK